MAWKLEAVVGSDVQMIGGQVLPASISVPAQYRKTYARKTSADAVANFLNIAAAEQMGRAAFANGTRRNCFLDPQWVELYNAWLVTDLRRANRLGEQWYRGWDRANCAAIVEL